MDRFALGGKCLCGRETACYGHMAAADHVFLNIYLALAALAAAIEHQGTRSRLLAGEPPDEAMIAYASRYPEEGRWGLVTNGAYTNLKIWGKVYGRHTYYRPQPQWVGETS